MQLRVVEVDDVQMGHDEETGRRAILVEPGMGGGADGMIVTLAGVVRGSSVPARCKRR